jgi:hypothetical protein
MAFDVEHIEGSIKLSTSTNISSRHRIRKTTRKSTEKTLNLHKFAHFTFGPFQFSFYFFYAIDTKRKRKVSSASNLLSSLRRKFIETRKCGSSSLNCPCYQIVVFLMASLIAFSSRDFKATRMTLKAHIDFKSRFNSDILFFMLAFSTVLFSLLFV